MTLDEKYIDKLRLQNISKVREGLYRMRCIFCGNGENNPNKVKSYFYLKGNSYNYRCRRCIAKRTFTTRDCVEGSPKPLLSSSSREMEKRQLDYQCGRYYLLNREIVFIKVGHTLICVIDLPHIILHRVRGTPSNLPPNSSQSLGNSK